MELIDKLISKTNSLCITYYLNINSILIIQIIDWRHIKVIFYNLFFSYQQKILKKIQSGKPKQPKPGLLGVHFGHFPPL